jgi:hypothetical protein
MSHAAATSPSRKRQRERRTYAPPRLTVHGDASRLTAALKGNTSDGKGGTDIP